MKRRLRRVRGLSAFALLALVALALALAAACGDDDDDGQPAAAAAPAAQVEPAPAAQVEPAPAAQVEPAPAAEPEPAPAAAPEPAPAAEPEPVVQKTGTLRIGMVYSFTGDMAWAGSTLSGGIRVATAMLNEGDARCVGGGDLPGGRRLHRWRYALHYRAGGARRPFPTSTRPSPPRPSWSGTRR